MTGKDSSIIKRSRTGHLSIFLSLVAAMLFILPAQSRLLEGHVEAGTEDTQDTQAVSHAATPVQTPNIQAPTQPTANLTPGYGVSDKFNPPLKTAFARPPVAAMDPYRLPNSFPGEFEGLWRCVTKVTDSAVSTVPVGSEMVSEVRFGKLPGGRIVAKWLQPGWTETQASAVGWSPREARVDRTNYYMADGVSGSWACRSRDQFVLQNAVKMSCSSYVDQYIDGLYIGRYRTISELTRLGPINSIARGEKAEN